MKDRKRVCGDRGPDSYHRVVAYLVSAEGKTKVHELHEKASFRGT